LVVSFQFGAVIELESDSDVETLVNQDYLPFVIPFEYNLLGLFESKDSKGKTNDTLLYCLPIYMNVLYISMLKLIFTTHLFCVLSWYKLLFDKVLTVLLAFKEYEAIAVERRGTHPFIACFGDVAKTW
jgi:hypothetical protein